MTGLELAVTWIGVALVGAVLALDETALAQTWLAQPLPAALCTGLVAGDPAAALVPGFFMQLLVLGNLPVGAASTLDATSATIGVVGGVLVAGAGPALGASPLAVWQAGAGWQIGLMLVIMAVASHLGGHLVRLERRSHLAWKLAVYRQLRDGDFQVVDMLQRRALGVCALRGAAVTLLVAVLVGMLWPVGSAAIPEAARRVLALAPLLTVPLAVGGLSDRVGHRRAAPWLVGSLVLGLGLGWWLW
ncbi:MAG: PTS sugar transporter subunit IIC [Candidatus Krumholzibacteriia bacterium]